MALLISVSICAVMPCVIVWLTMRKKSKETQMRCELLKTAVEYHADIDTNKMLALLTNRPKKLRHRLYNQFTIGLMAIVIGIALMALYAWRSVAEGILDDCFVWLGVIPFLLGAVLVGMALYGKRTFADELRQEGQSRDKEQLLHADDNQPQTEGQQA